MAVAIDTSSAWGLDNGTFANQTITTGTLSPAASSIVICVVGWYSDLGQNATIATPTNTGTALTWNVGNDQFVDRGNDCARTKIFWAYNTSSQSNITVSSACTGNGYNFGNIKAYSFTGHNTSSQLDSSNVAGHTSLVSSVAGGMLVATDFVQSSTDLTVSTSGNPNLDGIAGYKVLGAAGTYSFNFNAYFIESGIIIKAAAGGTAHTAAAAGTATATGTAAMRNARTLQASATGTATGTAAASNQRTLAASATGTASGTAAMSSTQAMSAGASVTASGTAAADVATLVTIDASGTITAVGTAGSTVTPQVTFQGNGTVIADGSAAMAKTMQFEATATATATSDAGMTHTFYVFKPPTREISPISLDPFYQLVGYFQGLTLVRRGGVWSLVQNKKQEYLDQSEYAFPGGRENRINGTEKTVLESAGYTVETRTS